MSCASDGNIMRFVGLENGSTERPESRKNDASGQTAGLWCPKMIARYTSFGLLGRLCILL